MTEKAIKLTLKKIMPNSDLQIFDSPSQQRKKRIFHDVLEYIFVMIITLSAIFTALLFFSDKLKAYF
ncbi:hypothetical protein CER18_04820 [Bartonella tribocorum]|uniref:Uncharacterized protein n=1 Tax=Bartonella tribocorum TaxID=85701 RepID=A0A2M6US72_9HYPH|nr:hypothetical protein CER18_04820 [Bartonella tribocorum]